ncbi:ATP synthase F1 subunit epsilon [Candidatus Gottesmanbacteria bacterium]|nr:ATP synthase F1 subunit epsilon [Candidatus Gottesmanbacteria bacterium]
MTFLLEIITPERIAYSEEVAMVRAPSAAGVVGILAHHEPLFSKLVEGELKIQKEKDEIFLAIGGGFLEVTPKKVTILVTEAVHAQEINEKEMLEAKRRAEEALKSKPTGAELVAAQNLFRRSTIALKISQRKRRTIS